MPSIASQAEPTLVRGIGLRSLTANIVNTTVGAGIFVLPALVARDLGTAAPLAYLTCAFVMVLVVSSFAAAGSRVSLTGGLYAYVEVALGPYPGFLTGLLVWLSCLLGAASVASAFASSVGLVVPGVEAGIGRMLLLGLVFGALATINVLGVTIAARVVEAATLLKLAPLLLLIVAGVAWVQPANMQVTWAPPARVGSTALTLIFAFVGVEVALLPSGEIRDPARTVPRAVFLALAITTVLYLALQFVAHATLGDALGQHQDAPLADTAARVLGSWGRALVLAGGAVSMLGYLSGDVLGSPRSLFAFARDGLAPSFLGSVHPTYRTPWTAIITHAAMAWVAGCVGSFGALALLANVAILTSYLLCTVAAIVLERKDVRTSGTPFRPPGGPLVPLGASVALVWLLSHATAQELVVNAVTVAVGSALFGLRALRRRGGLRDS